jgi:hypothetical protein
MTNVRRLGIGAGVILAGLIVAGVFLWIRSRPTSAPTVTAPEHGGGAAAADAGPASVRPEFRRLVGKWLRPDGGYVLEIRAVDASGTMEAGYFNPRPIGVFKANAALENSATKVFVELRDAGYPGCTYTLTYVPGPDKLAGIYYQAAIQQDFPVEFERMKE